MLLIIFIKAFIYHCIVINLVPNGEAVTETFYFRSISKDASFGFEGNNHGFVSSNILKVITGIDFKKYNFVGIRQWLINWCTSQMMINKISPFVD